MVVGGDSEGTAEVLIDGAAVGQPVAGVMDGVRESGSSSATARAVPFGWAAPTPPTPCDKTRSLRWLSERCVSAAGPQWTTARLDALQPAQSALVIGGDGSQLVDEVRWNGADVEIQQLLQLDVPRAGAGGIVLESGAFVVAGGDDGVSIREDFEFCVPAALEPL